MILCYSPFPKSTITMAEHDHVTLLPKLGAAIDTALASWEAYLETLTEQPTFETIIADDTKDLSTKIQAIQHLLETLPSRHSALVNSYADDKLDVMELSDHCIVLLEELQKPRSERDLDGWFDKVLSSKRLATSIKELEKELQAEEQWRAQVLRRLKGQHMALMMVRADGELGRREVEALLDAMEALGVSLIGSGAVHEEAVDGVQDGTGNATVIGEAGVRKSGEQQ